MSLLIREKYQIISKIGQGKFGKVFKAINIKSKNNQINDIVAIKMERINCRILKHEATILNYLNKNKCINIPYIHYYGIHDDIPCLVTPFYHYSLTQFIEDIKNQEQEYKMIQCNRLMQKMLDIIKNCHVLFVLHRDIKPDNFMFDHNNQLILLDFGLATFIYPETNSIETNSFVGNTIFASPNIHECKKYQKIDDVISISYIYLFIYLGTLPWMNLDDIGQEKFDKILFLKRLISTSDDNEIFEFIKNSYENKVLYTLCKRTTC